MPGNRKAMEDYIIKSINELTGDNSNEHLYRYKFDNMSDKEFDAWVISLEEGVKEGLPNLVVEVPNFSSTSKKMTMPFLFEIMDKRKMEFFKQIVIPPRDDVPGYITANKYLVGITHVCRQSQSVVKKRAIAEKNGITDALTGQAAGDSKMSSISAPESGVILAAGLKHSLNELLTYRGGDQDGLAAMQSVLTRTGSVSLNAIEPYRGGVTSTKTLDSYLKGAHINSTIVE